MSLSNNFPTIAPSLNLDFANVKALDPRISFVRTTTATYYGTETAKTEENLFTYSQEFDNAAWTKQNSTVTANTEVAPDGTTTAEKLDENNVTGEFQVRQTGPSMTTFVASVFAKAGERDKVYLQFVATSNEYVFFDLTLGTVIDTYLSSSSNTASRASAITSVGNGWYRCSITITLNSAAAPSIRVGITDTITNNVPTYLGTAGDGIYIWGAQLEQRSAVSAYTATTTQAITNYIPVLQTAASGVARFDHNPTTGESLGLLVEEQRTNLLTYSAEFDNAAWTKTNSSITANTIVAPDGALTGDKVVEDTATGTHGCNQNITPVSGTTYAVSIYAKAGERTLVRIATGASLGTKVAFVDLSSGTITSESGTGTASVTSVGNGWYRISLVVTATSTSADGLFVRLVSTGTTFSYTGDGYSGIYIWGAQLEAGAFPTSYIVTTSASVTRNADAASMTGANFSSWFNNAEGTFYVEAQKNAASSSAIFVSASDNSFNNRQAFVYVTTTQLRYRSITNTVNDVAINKTVSASDFVKAAGAYKFNDFSFVTNADAAGTDTSALVPTVSQLNIGSEFNNTVFLNGAIKKLAFYPARLSDAQLQALTTV